MKLESVTAELRPRSDWEAIDLGLALVRRDFWKMTRAWWLGMLPILLIGLPLLWDHKGWFAFIFWWWIPVCSRLAMFKLSRRLFGDNPGMRDLLKEFPKSIKRRFFYRMFWARISPWRPLTMAVEDLEGLRGKDYSARCRILMRRGDSSLVVLALWRIALVVWLMITMFFTIMLFIPEAISMEWWNMISIWFDGGLDAGLPTGMELIILASACSAMWLVDLFSVGCGFGLYVNHRSWIEGWDVELAFRRLGNRLRGISAVIIAALAIFLSGDLQAQEGDVADEKAASDPAIDEVLSHEDFTIHTETTKEWIPPDWLKDWNWGSGSSSASTWSGFEFLSVLIKTLGIIGLVALVVWLIYRYRHLITPKGGEKAPEEKAKARVVMGMEVTAESLPKDIPNAAMEAWRSGQRHKAMSLLYRGAISWMIRHGGIEIAESDTENDCLSRVQRSQLSQTGYFKSLTDTWICLAYARQIPADEEMESLCGQWPFVEGGAR